MHVNTVHVSMTTAEMFTALLTGRDPVPMEMEAALQCLGIMGHKCVDIMYSTGMCAHMAVIKHTRSDAVRIVCMFKTESLTVLRHKQGFHIAAFSRFHLRWAVCSYCYISFKREH